MATIPLRFNTAGSIAAAAGVSRDAVQSLITSQKIEEIGRAANTRIYSDAQAEQIIAALRKRLPPDGGRPDRTVDQMAAALETAPRSVLYWVKELGLRPMRSGGIAFYTLNDQAAIANAMAADAAATDAPNPFRRGKTR